MAETLNTSPELEPDLSFPTPEQTEESKRPLESISEFEKRMTEERAYLIDELGPLEDEIGGVEVDAEKSYFQDARPVHIWDYETIEKSDNSELLQILEGFTEIEYQDIRLNIWENTFLNSVGKQKIEFELNSDGSIGLIYLTDIKTWKLDMINVDVLQSAIDKYTKK